MVENPEKRASSLFMPVIYLVLTFLFSSNILQQVLNTSLDQ